MSMLFLAKAIGTTVAGAYCETNFLSSFSSSATLSRSDGTTSVSVSPFFGLTPLILSGLGFWAFAYGMNVGVARNKAMEAAKKDGEKDVKERYDLPNLYVQGTSKHARVFNCIQRSHQHIFETYPTIIVTGLIAATQYPIFAAGTTLMYAVGRISLSNGYAKSDGDASKRYENSSFARYMWYGVLINLLLSFLSCANIIAGKKLI